VSAPNTGLPRIVPRERNVRAERSQPALSARGLDAWDRLDAILHQIDRFTNSARNVDRLAEGVEVGNLSINHFVASSAAIPLGA
jgi:hypothetical protein